MNNHQNSLLEDVEPRLNLVQIYIGFLLPYFVIALGLLYSYNFEKMILGLKGALVFDLYILVLSSILLNKTKLTGDKLVITYPYNPFRKTVELHIPDIETGKLSNFPTNGAILSVWYKKASTGKLIKKVIPIRTYQADLLHFIDSLQDRGLTLKGGIAKSYYDQIEVARNKVDSKNMKNSSR